MRIRRCLLVGCIVTTLTITGATVVRAQTAPILDMVPADAWGAMILRDLKGVNDKAIAFGKALDLPIGPNTMIGDPLTMLKGMLGAAEGLDDSGSLALVITRFDPKSLDSIEHSMVLLVPCTDAEAFLEQFGTMSAEPTTSPGQEPSAEQEKLHEGVKAIELMGQPSFAAVKGHYAIIAPSVETLDAYRKGQGTMRSVLSPERLAYAEKKADLLIWLNMKELGPAVRQPVTDAIMGVMLLMSMGDPSAAQNAKQIVENVQKFLDETSSLEISLAMDTAGIDLGFYVEVKPDTEMAKQLSKQRSSTGSLLRGLPNEPYVVAMGAAGNSATERIADAEKSIDMLLNKPQITEAVDPAKLTDFRKDLSELLALAPLAEWVSVSVSMLPPTDDGMVGVTVVASLPQGAQRWLTTMRTLVPAALQLCPNQDVNEWLSKVQYTEGSEKIGSAVVDHVSFPIAELPDIAEDDVAKLKKILGADGLLLRLAALDEDHVAVLFGGGAKRVEQVAALVTSNAAPLADSAGIQNVATQLPKGPRSVEMYIAADTGMRMVNALFEAAGEAKPLPVEIPDIDAPAAVLMTVGPNHQQLDVYVPMKLIVGVKDVVQATMMAGAAPVEEEEDLQEEDVEPAPAPASPGGGIK